MKKFFKNIALMALSALTFAFMACEDVPEPYDIPGTPSNLPGTETIGTADEPITVAEARTLIEGYANGGSSKSYAFVKGIVSRVQSYNSTYKSITYYISEDGTTSNELQCYSGKNLGGADFDSQNDLQVGAVVVVKGKLKKYVNANTGAITYELDQSNELVSVEGNEVEPAVPSGDGTLENPLNAAAANEIAARLENKETSAESYYIKGKVANIKYNYGAGNYPKTADFYISDDGNNSNTFYVYAAKYLGNKDYSSGTVLKVGDDVIIYGQLYNYNGTPETAQNKSYLYSLNGVTEGGNDDPEEPVVSGEGSYDQPYTAETVIAKGTASTTANVFVKAYIVGTIDGQVISTGAKFGSDATVKTNLLIADSPTETNVDKCVPVQLPNGAVRTGINLQDNPSLYGKQVLLYGNLEKYFGVAGIKSVTYAECDGKQFGTKPEGGNSDPATGDDAKVVTVAEFNAASESTSVWYQLTGTISNLKDGDKYGNFDLTDETGSVYVYGVLSEKGGAKQLFQDLVTKYGLTNGTTITIIGNRGSYNGKVEVTNAYFVSAK